MDPWAFTNSTQAAITPSTTTTASTTPAMTHAPTPFLFFAEPDPVLLSVDTAAETAVSSDSSSSVPGIGQTGGQIYHKRRIGHRIVHTMLCGVTYH